jgi:hypothetical protein
MGKQKKLVPLSVGLGKRHGTVNVPVAVKNDSKPALAAILETYGDAVAQARAFVTDYMARKGSLPDWQGIELGLGIQGTPEYYVSALNALGHECCDALKADDRPRAAKARDALCAIWGVCLERGALTTDQARGEKTLTAASDGGARRKGKRKVTTQKVTEAHGIKTKNITGQGKKGRAIAATAKELGVSESTVKNRLRESREAAENA